MRALNLPVNSTDAVHVYSDDTHIWLQLRRDVPTEVDIGRSTFKVAVCLQPGTAQKLSAELTKVSTRNAEKQKAKARAGAAAKSPKKKVGAS
jgi:hypothetical protein